MLECPVREAPLEAAVAFTVERVTREDESLDIGLPLDRSAL